MPQEGIKMEEKKNGMLPDEMFQGVVGGRTDVEEYDETIGWVLREIFENPYPPVFPEHGIWEEAKAQGQRVYAISRYGVGLYATAAPEMELKPKDKIRLGMIRGLYTYCIESKLD